MIIEDRKSLEQIYQDGTYNLHHFRVSMLIGFIESIITFISSLAAFIFSNGTFVSLLGFVSVLLIMFTFFIWRGIFFNPWMLTVIILHPQDIFKKTQKILVNSKIKFNAIHRILIVPQNNGRNLLSGVYIETNKGVFFYDFAKKIVPTSNLQQNAVFKKNKPLLIFVSFSYAIKNGEICFNRQNYYEDARLHAVNRNVKKMERQNTKALKRLKK